MQNKTVDIKGFEPLTFSMQSRRSTTDLNARTRVKYYSDIYRSRTYGQDFSKRNHIIDYYTGVLLGPTTVSTFYTEHSTTTIPIIITLTI